MDVGEDEYSISAEEEAAMIKLMNDLEMSGVLQGGKPSRLDLGFQKT